MLGIVLPASYILLEALLEGSGRAKLTRADDDDMAHIKDDSDASIAKDSVFDWGQPHDGASVSKDASSALSSLGMNDASGGRDPVPSSRYDPKAMSRIVDITDLVDDSDEDSDSGDFEDVGAPRPQLARKRSDGGGGGRRRGRCLALAAVAAVVVSAAVTIGYVVLYPEEGRDMLRPTKMGGGQEGARQQMMLETAERVAAACDVTSEVGDADECFELCRGKDCCFDPEDSCADDEGAECALYGGCLALREGLPYDAAEEEEERKDRG